MPSKIPMRGIGKLLTNLDPGVRARLEDAFVEAEDLNNFHNNATINDQQKRVLSSLVDAPVLHIDTNTLGYDANWPRLKDRLISFYELQVSTDSNFATVQTFKTVDNFFSAEGVTADTFIRVRGVRWDGKCSNWSNTVSVSGASTLSTPTVYTRDISDLPSFYIEFPALVTPDALQFLNITPTKANGGVVVFGSFGVEFYVNAAGRRNLYANTDPDAPFYDAISVTANGRHINKQEAIIVTPNDDFLTPSRINAVGYSVGFGPALISHAAFYRSNYEMWPNAVTQGATHGANGTHDGWHNLAGGTGIVEPVITNVTTDGSYYTVTGLASGTSTTTKTYTTKKYYFNIPSDRTVLGIEVLLYNEGFVTGGAGTPTMTVDIMNLVDENGNNRPTNRAAGEVLLTEGPGGIPLALTYGSPTDLWGEIAGFWTPAKINDKDFGQRTRFAVSVAGGGTSDVFMVIYATEMKIFTNNGTESARVDLVYIPRTDDLVTWPETRAVVKNCTINAIEFGDDL